MAGPEILRGKVTAYPSDSHKGLVEVAVAAYAESGETLYARVGQCMSGVYWLPEIGDVVEVALPARHGAEACIVAVHRQAGDQQTADCWTQENDCKQLRTRSGHTITLSDKKDAGLLRLETAGGLIMLLDDKEQTVALHGKERQPPMLLLNMKERTVQLAAEKGLTISCAGAELKIDGSGNVSLSAKGKLSLSAQEVSIEGKTKLSEKAPQVEVSADMSAKVSAQGQLELSASGVTEVKGGVIKLN